MNISKKSLIKILDGDSEEINKMREILSLNGKLCKCCGMHFIPDKRADEKYCKKCRKVGYEKTLSSNSENCIREYKRLYALYMRKKITKEEMKIKYEQYKKEREE